jgi:hypothetical protein
MAYEFLKYLRFYKRADGLPSLAYVENTIKDNRDKVENVVETGKSAVNAVVSNVPQMGETSDMRSTGRAVVDAYNAANTGVSSVDALSRIKKLDSDKPIQSAYNAARAFNDINGVSSSIKSLAEADVPSDFAGVANLSKNLYEGGTNGRRQLRTLIEAYNPELAQDLYTSRAGQAILDVGAAAAANPVRWWVTNPLTKGSPWYKKMLGNLVPTGMGAYGTIQMGNDGSIAHELRRLALNNPEIALGSAYMANKLLGRYFEDEPITHQERITNVVKNPNSKTYFDALSDAVKHNAATDEGAANGTLSTLQNIAKYSSEISPWISLQRLGPIGWTPMLTNLAVRGARVMNDGLNAINDMDDLTRNRFASQQPDASDIFWSPVNSQVRGNYLDRLPRDAYLENQLRADAKYVPGHKKSGVNQVGTYLMDAIPFADPAQTTLSKMSNENDEAFLTRGYKKLDDIVKEFPYDVREKIQRQSVGRYGHNLDIATRYKCLRQLESQAAFWKKHLADNPRH